MHKTLAFTLLLIPLVTLPAMAQLGKVWTDFQFYSQDLQDYLKNHFSETLNPIESQPQIAIYSATGQMNIPDPIAGGKLVNDQALYNSLFIYDKFDNNAQMRSVLISNELNRLLTRGAIAGVMGANGQVRLKEKLTEAEQSLNNIATIAGNADNLFQTLMNNVQSAANTAAPGLGSLLNGQAGVELQGIKIQQEQSKIITETLAQTVQENQFLQYSNLNLANISQQMDEVNRSRRVDTTAEAARLLRITSQIDLFGRKPPN